MQVNYGTAQIQLHTRTHTGLLARVSTCYPLCVMEYSRVSLTVHMIVLHEVLHTRMCYSSGYKLATRHVRVLLACMCNTSINVDTFYTTFIYGRVQKKVNVS